MTGNGILPKEIVVGSNHGMLVIDSEHTNYNDILENWESNKRGHQK